MAENLPFNSRQHSPCIYGGVVVVPQGDRWGDDHRVEVGRRHSPCAARLCSLLARIEREALNMVENLSFNARQHSPCKYGGVVVVPSGDHPINIEQRSGGGIPPPVRH